MEINIGKNIKALIFDLDGTLADSMPVHLIAWEIVGIKYGFQYSKKELEKYAGMSTQEIVDTINKKNNLKLDPDQISHELELKFLENLDKVKPIKPISNLLQTYYGRLPIAVGTGGLRGMAVKILKHIEVWDKIDILVASEDVNNHKPSPETFLKCAEKLRVKPSDCLVFEDVNLGFQAAKNAGMHLIDVRPYR